MFWLKKKQRDLRYSRAEVYPILARYILDCISYLCEAEKKETRAKVRRVFGGDHNWKHTVRISLRLPETLDEELRQMWMEEQGEHELTRLIDPVAFAEQMAIEVAVHMIPDSLFDP